MQRWEARVRAVVCNDLAAFDLEGNLLWLRGLTVDYANASNSLGMASSPIVDWRDVVTMIENDSESYTLGIDANTGRNLWKMERPKSANWSSPVVWQADKESAPVVVLQSSKGLVGVDPATGSRLWEYTDGASTTSSGVVVGGHRVCGVARHHRAEAREDGGAPEQLWRSEQMSPSTDQSGGDRRTGSSAINGAGVLSVADIKTGDRGWKLRIADVKQRWLQRLAGRRGEALVVATKKGLLQIVDTTAPGGRRRRLAATSLKEDTKEMVLCTPALSGNAIFLRTDSALWRVGGE